MREFVFDICYPDGKAPIQELFGPEQAPETVGVGGCIEQDEFWRIERYSNEESALDPPDESQLEQLLAVESITESTCNGTVHAEILERSADKCEVYYHIRGVSNCDSIQTLAVDYLGTDVLFELERTANRDTWTVLMESDDGTGLFYDAIQACLHPELRFVFDHVGQASDRRMDLFAKKNLPQEQRESLVAAVKQGYYETPRQITLEELATDVGCPRSTLSYRLRKAESKLAKAFALDKNTSELQGFPQTPTEGDAS